MIKENYMIRSKEKVCFPHNSPNCENCFSGSVEVIKENWEKEFDKIFNKIFLVNVRHQAFTTEKRNNEIAPLFRELKFFICQNFVPREKVKEAIEKLKEDTTPSKDWVKKARESVERSMKMFGEADKVELEVAVEQLTIAQSRNQALSDLRRELLEETIK